jgi:hypothetical protein
MTARRRRRDAGREAAATHLWPRQHDAAERVALIRTCERLLALGPAHAVIAFALLSGVVRPTRSRST